MENDLGCDDQEIVRRAMKGDEKAFIELKARCHKAIYDTYHSRIKIGGLHNQLVTDYKDRFNDFESTVWTSFFSTLKNKGDIDFSIENLGGYVRTIARNRISDIRADAWDHRRDSSGAHTHYFESLDQVTTNDDPDFNNDPNNSSLQSEVAERFSRNDESANAILIDQIRSLASEKQKEVIDLKLAERSKVDICRILGITNYELGLIETELAGIGRKLSLNDDD